MSKKIASIFDKNDDDDNSDHEHRHQQAFFAGGSEHSGQQILGPERETNLIENVMRDARLHSVETSAPSEGTVLVTFWRNGFTVGENGELRDYESNREFLSKLRKGLLPDELTAKIRDGQVDVKLNDKSHLDYEPSRERTPAFVGEGHRLGAPAPSVLEADGQGQSSSSSSSEAAKPSLDAIRQARLARFAQKSKKDAE